MDITYAAVEVEILRFGSISGEATTKRLFEIRKGITREHCKRLVLLICANADLLRKAKAREHEKKHKGRP